jgi:CO dehydrogenase/acetyl-CoA synthase beta subunit
MQNELPEDIKVEALTESQWRDLKELKNWIYRQRVKHRKEKARGERRKAEEEAETRELETRPVQPSFF